MERTCRYNSGLRGVRSSAMGIACLPPAVAFGHSCGKRTSYVFPFFVSSPFERPRYRTTHPPPADECTLAAVNSPPLQFMSTSNPPPGLEAPHGSGPPRLRQGRQKIESAVVTLEQHLRNPVRLQTPDCECLVQLQEPTVYSNASFEAWNKDWRRSTENSSAPVSHRPGKRREDRCASTPRRSGSLLDLGIVLECSVVDITGKRSTSEA